jgi:hypothetical protein
MLPPGVFESGVRRAFGLAKGKAQRKEAPHDQQRRRQLPGTARGRGRTSA